MSKQRLAEIVAELKRRHLLRPSFLDKDFIPQYTAATDKAPFKAVQCTRRAGKTTGEVGEQLQEAFDSPGTKHLFMALTLDSARNIAWDMINEMLEREKIGHRSHRQTGEIFFDNGSYYRMLGVDASYQEMKKVLGGKYKTVKIDEAGSMRQNLKQLCYQMIGPALIDQDGRLTLLGTAENIPKTFFESVTSGKEPGWSVHKWTTLDNPYMREKWQKHLEWIQQNNPAFMNTSEFKTHYLNLWVADDNKLIIKTNENTVIPEKKLEGYDYVLGVDLGYNDASSFVIMAYSIKDPNAYVVEAFKQTEMDITSVAETIRVLMRKYPVGKIIVDGANKQGVEEMRNRHRLPLEAAEKSDKATFLKLFADDITQNKVQLFQGKTQALLDEWQSLQWEDEYRQAEDPRCENHCNDAGLYSWRYVRNYLYTPEAAAKPKFGEKDYMNLYARELEKRRRSLYE